MKIDKYWFTWLLVICFLIGFFVGGVVLEKVSYKQGQRDALNGKWEYEYRADTLLYKIEKP